ncbi:hypothetical protein [Arcobacter sp. LA11]|uniref:hypothetical protein n=1 Tax=Arcobacter sp. LA11 TaxID=1898176 RepID=UPI0009335835|nr:hypothetical protein [Arcobacter sp. LA11]
MRLLNIIIIFFLFSNILNAKENSSYIGILSEKIFTTQKEAKIAAKIWTKYMSEIGYENVFIKFYDDENVLIADYLNNKVSTILGTYQMYYKNKSIIDNVSKRRWIPTISKNTFEQFYLIKNVDSEITINNLNNKILNYKDNIGKIWLDSIIMSKYKKSVSKVFSEIIDIKKPQKLIFNVFFNKNQLSVVSKKLYDDMIELNPQIKNKIEILEKSKITFISGIGFTSKKINPYYDDMLKNIRKDIDKKGIIKLSPSINIYEFYDISNEELKPLDSFFSFYLNLKRKYN